MPKNDFDRDFDFEKESDFDPKAFLGTEEYDDDIDLDAFSDEELGLGSQEEADEDDLDVKEYRIDFQQEEVVPEEEEGPDVMFFRREPVEEPTAEEAFAEGEEVVDPSVFEDAPESDEDDIDYEEGESDYDEEAYDEDEDENPEPKPPFWSFLTKIKLPKFTTPKIFIKFYDLYFAPVLNKELREEPRDPNNPRRRRKKSKIQIFKEVYLPPIVACICLILVLSFAIGSLTNAIEARRIANDEKDKQMAAESEAADLIEQEYMALMDGAKLKASSYDFEGAVGLIDSFSGDITQYPDMAALRAEYVNTMTQLIEHRDPSMIPNLSFHVLIEDLDRALKDESLGGKYNRNFVSTAEFRQILEHLYANGYVLVDFDSFVTAATLNDTQSYITKPIYLPSGKKPVMITETLVNYYQYMVDPDKDGTPDAKGAGFANKLVVENGEIKAAYVDASGNNLVGDYDLVPILETFIKDHPDFSYQGARAILAVTGDEGIFGYRINTSNQATKGAAWLEAECNAAKEVVQALRNKGYTLACFTYKNQNYAGMSAAQIQADLTEWTKNITPVIGQVETLVFAQEGNLSSYSSSAFDVLYNTGFRYFVSSDTKPWATVENTYVRQNRLMVTGRTMQHFPDQFNGLFDCAAILNVNLRGNIAK